jgi:hypothetical protein
MASWELGTKNNIMSFITMWCHYCRQEKVNSFHPIVEIRFRFRILMQQYTAGLGYESLNIASIA